MRRFSLTFHLAALQKQTQESYCRDYQSTQLLLAKCSPSVAEGSEPSRTQSLQARQYFFPRPKCLILQLCPSESPPRAKYSQSHHFCPALSGTALYHLSSQEHRSFTPPSEQIVWNVTYTLCILSKLLHNKEISFSKHTECDSASSRLESQDASRLQIHHSATKCLVSFPEK